MNSSSFNFLAVILGSDGSNALKKAIESHPSLSEVIVPRTVLAWMRGIESFEGSIPGMSNSYLELHKSEDQYTGSVTIGEELYSFEDKDTAHVVAAISVALGMIRTPLNKTIKESHLIKIGKSIDVLANANKATKDIKAVAKDEDLEESNDLEKGLMPKTGGEGQGPAAAPKGPTAPVPPAAVQAVKGPPGPGSAGASVPKIGGGIKGPALPKRGASLKPLKVTKSEAEAVCDACGCKQFEKNIYVGCVCFSALAKNIKTITYSDGFVLEPNNEIGEDEYLALFRQLLFR